MSNTPNYDAKVKSILEATKPGERVCSLTGEKWDMTEEEISWYKKFNVPPSNVCPQMRWAHHGVWYVGFQFWYQNHPVTGKPIIGTIHPATGLKMLPDKEWFEQEFLEKGKNYDANRSFFEQWRELELSVPLPANRNHLEPKNSIAFVSQGDEDSYFVGACKSKRSLYCHIAMDIEDSAEIFNSFTVQSSFNIVRSFRIFQSQFIRESRDCLNSSFLFDCRNCEFCFGATNKRNRKYLWWNEQLSKEEWEKRRAQVDFGSRKNLDGLTKQFYEFIKDQGIWPENFNEGCIDSTGEYLTKTARVKECYSLPDGCHDQYWCNLGIGMSEENAFSGYAIGSNHQYYSASCSRSEECKYCFLNIQCHRTEYCFLCYNCEDCFGCIGLQRKRFCILNKQYTEEDYYKKLDQIKCVMLDKKEYGEFFPAEYSPTYYKDSGAIWFGITHEECRKLGVLDYDPESLGAIGQDLVDPSKIRQVEELPDHINDLGDDWIGVPLFDQGMNRRFSLIAPEIAFYRRMHLAPPKKHFMKRIHELWIQTNVGRFEESFCSICQQKLRVAKNFGHPQRKIYCKKCYLRYLEERG